MTDLKLSNMELENKYKILNKTFHFAKVNINGNIFSANEQELDRLIKIEIPTLIKNSPEKQIKSGGTFSFADVINIGTNDSPILLGNLTYSIDKEPRILHKETRTTEATKIKNLATSASFLYHVNSEILGYSSSDSINHDKFKQRFKELLETNEKIGSVKIIDYPKNHKIIEIFKSLSKITYIKFSIIPPNPKPINANKLKGIIQDTKTKELEISLRDPKGHLDILNDGSIEIKTEKDLSPTIAEGVEYVEKGYGSVQINGENKSTKKKIRFFSNKNTEKTTLKGSDHREALQRGLAYLSNLIKKI